MKTLSKILIAIAMLVALTGCVSDEEHNEALGDIAKAEQSYIFAMDEIQSLSKSQQLWKELFYDSNEATEMALEGYRKSADDWATAVKEYKQNIDRIEAETILLADQLFTANMAIQTFGREIESLEIALEQCQSEPNTPVWGQGELSSEWLKYFGNGNLSRFVFAQNQIVNNQGSMIAGIVEQNGKLNIVKPSDPNQPAALLDKDGGLK